jgi:hypothetical protein
MGDNEKIGVIVGGVAYRDWEKVCLSLKGEVWEVEIESTRPPAPLFFAPQTAFQIYANGRLLIDGEVVRFEAVYSSVSCRIHVYGRGGWGKCEALARLP